MKITIYLTKNVFVLLFFISFNLFGQIPQSVSGIMTDYNGYKLSLVGDNGATATNSQNLLAFKINISQQV